MFIAALEISEEIFRGNKLGQAIVGIDNISTYDFPHDFCSESIRIGYSFARNLSGNLKRK